MHTPDPGSTLATSSRVLFAVFLISLLATVGLAIYLGGALFGVRRNRVDSFSVPPPVSNPYITLPTPPPAPLRVARGTTPPPIPRAASPKPPGVISNRDDATDPEIPADARFSVRKSRPRV